MSWTQPLCEDCWDERYLSRVSVRDVDGPAETCCLCGHATTSGIFIRIDPASVPFPRTEASDA